MYLYSTIFRNFCLVSIKKSTDVSINTPVALFYICLLYVSTTGISTLSGITAIIRGSAIVRFIGIFSIFRRISVSSAFSGIVVPTMFRFGIVILITGIAVVIVRLVIIFGASVRCIIFLLALGSLLVIRLVFFYLVFFAHLVVFFLFLLLLIFKIIRKLSIRKEIKRR